MEEIKSPCHAYILLQKIPSFLLQMISQRVKYLRRSSKSNPRQVWQIINGDNHPGDDIWSYFALHTLPLLRKYLPFFFLMTFQYILVMLPSAVIYF